MQQATLQLLPGMPAFEAADAPRYEQRHFAGRRSLTRVRIKNGKLVGNA